MTFFPVPITMSKSKQKIDRRPSLSTMHPVKQQVLDWHRSLIFPCVAALHERIVSSEALYLTNVYSFARQINVNIPSFRQ
jgi:hypothetical protein